MPLFFSGVEWGLVFPEANGEYQSPINLNSREARYDPTLLQVSLSPNYVVCRDCEVINDGHTVRILLKSKSVVTGGPLPRDHDYELHEVRFHWGRENQRGSEHTVNFKAFPMELHLIHWNTTLYNSIDEALGKRNGILIIALFVQIGKEHLGLKAITEILQDTQYKGKTKIIPCFNPNTLLPDPLLRDYWVYEGSLTMPPCSENVTWILYRYPLTVSQIQPLKALLRQGKTGQLPRKPETLCRREVCTATVQQQPPKALLRTNQSDLPPQEVPPFPMLEGSCQEKVGVDRQQPVKELLEEGEGPLLQKIQPETSGTAGIQEGKRLEEQIRLVESGTVFCLICGRYMVDETNCQIEEFRRLRSHIKGAELPEGSDGLLGDNFRPTQPLSDRIIRAAFQ
ncbi:CAH8 protein, partial [Polyodon spathula]|nr:CAH8 protein [Polyodon spathula]